MRLQQINVITTGLWLKKMTQKDILGKTGEMLIYTTYTF